MIGGRNLVRYGAALVQAEAEQRQVDMEQSLAVQQQRVPAVEAEVRAALQECARLDAETRRDWLSALMTAEVKAASLRREWEKARLRHEVVRASRRSMARCRNSPSIRLAGSSRRGKP